MQARPMSWPPAFHEPVDRPYRTDATPAARRFAALIEANEAFALARYLWRPGHFRPVLMKLAAAAGLPACAGEEDFADALATLDLRPVAAELTNPAMWADSHPVPTPFDVFLTKAVAAVWRGDAS